MNYEFIVIHHKDPVVWRLITANPGLNLEQRSCFFFSEAFDFHKLL